MKYYNITIGQLITLWVFGAIAWFAALLSLSIIFLLIIPAFLVFYTIGWRVNNKSSGIENSTLKNFCSGCGSKISDDVEYCQSCGNKNK